MSILMASGNEERIRNKIKIEFKNPNYIDLSENGQRTIVINGQKEIGKTQHLNNQLKYKLQFLNSKHVFPRLADIHTNTFKIKALKPFSNETIRELQKSKIFSSKHYIDEEELTIKEYKDKLANYYSLNSEQIIGHQVKGHFGIKFYDKQGIFRSFNTEDKNNFKITSVPFFSAKEVDFKFKHHKDYSIIPFTKRCRTSAFWIDFYMVATWFTIWEQPVSNAIGMEIDIPLYPVPYGKLEGFNSGYYYVPTSLLNLFKNTIASTDYSIEWWLYQDYLSKHNPRKFEIYSLFFAKIYVSSSPVSYITQILPDKAGELQAIIENGNQRLFVWRRKDEILNEQKYIAKGSMVVDFIGTNQQYSMNYVRSLGYDI